MGWVSHAGFVVRPRLIAVPGVRGYFLACPRKYPKRRTPRRLGPSGLRGRTPVRPRSLTTGGWPGNLCTNRWCLWLTSLFAIEAPSRRRAHCPPRGGNDECGQTREPHTGGSPRAHLRRCGACEWRRPFTAHRALHLDPWRSRRGTIDSCRDSLRAGSTRPPVAARLGATSLSLRPRPAAGRETSRKGITPSLSAVR